MRLRLPDLFAPVDIASVAVFRALIGAVMFVAIVRFAANGWIDELYIQPTYRFSYWGFSWLPRLSAAGYYALFSGLGILSLMITIGLLYRSAVVLFFIGFSYIELHDQSTYLNHYYFINIITLMMIFMPMHRALSVDAHRRPQLRQATTDAWVPGALRAQLSLVYLYAGIAKLNPDWLFHAQPLRIWLQARADWPWVGPWLASDLSAYAMAWGGALFDLTITFGLWHPRLRRGAYGAVVGFHLVTGLLFQIGMFPWIMIAATTVFFAPSWPRRLIPHTWWDSAPNLPHRLVPRWYAPLVRVALSVHFCVQVVIPLRFLAYPGHVLWHEQGFRFGWRVMLVEKTGMVMFRVVDPTTGRHWHIAPSDELSALQNKAMSTQPEMIVHYAHHIARTFADRGIGPVEVRADAWASINGRRSQRLIDPDIDLAKESNGLQHKSWILPFVDSAIP